jgi:hypothetical protein
MFCWCKKSGLAISLFLGISLCALACLSTFVLAEKFEESTSQPPIKSLYVTIDASQRQELFEQMRRFADKHAFEYNLTDYGGQGKYFLVEIRGDNIKILANETSRDLTSFEISFFAPSPNDPIPNEKILDELVIDLKSFINEIPNVTISEEE